VSLTCGYPANINAGNAQAYGPEVETSFRVTDALTFNLSGAYTKAEINDPNATAQAAGFYPGIKIINVPEYTAVAALDYQQPINDNYARRSISRARWWARARTRRTTAKPSRRTISWT
jgi:outer membrane receptor protein involved in Fe transport